MSAPPEPAPIPLFWRHPRRPVIFPQDASTLRRLYVRQAVSSSSSSSSSTPTSSTSYTRGANGCVVCPSTAPPCPVCPSGQVCSLSLQSCDTCPEVSCVDESIVTSGIPGPKSTSSATSTTDSTTSSASSSSTQTSLAASATKDNSMIGPIIGATVGGVALASFCAFFFFWWLRRRRQATAAQASSSNTAEEEFAEKPSSDKRRLRRRTTGDPAVPAGLSSTSPFDEKSYGFATDGVDTSALAGFPLVPAVGPDPYSSTKDHNQAALSPIGLGPTGPLAPDGSGGRAASIGAFGMSRASRSSVSGPAGVPEGAFVTSLVDDGPHSYQQQPHPPRFMNTFMADQQVAADAPLFEHRSRKKTGAIANPKFLEPATAETSNPRSPTTLHEQQRNTLRQMQMLEQAQLANAAAQLQRAAGGTGGAGGITTSHAQLQAQAAAVQRKLDEYDASARTTARESESTRMFAIQPPQLRAPKAAGETLSSGSRNDSCGAMSSIISLPVHEQLRRIGVQEEAFARQVRATREKQVARLAQDEYERQKLMGPGEARHSISSEEIIDEYLPESWGGAGSNNHLVAAVPEHTQPQQGPRVGQVLSAKPSTRQDPAASHVIPIAYIPGVTSRPTPDLRPATGISHIPGTHVPRVSGPAMSPVAQSPIDEHFQDTLAPIPSHTPAPIPVHMQAPAHPSAQIRTPKQTPTAEQDPDRTPETSQVPAAPRITSGSSFSYQPIYTTRSSSSGSGSQRRVSGTSSAYRSTTLPPTLPLGNSSVTAITSSLTSRSTGSSSLSPSQYMTPGRGAIMPLSESESESTSSDDDDDDGDEYYDDANENPTSSRSNLMTTPMEMGMMNNPPRRSQVTGPGVAPFAESLLQEQREVVSTAVTASSVYSAGNSSEEYFSTLPAAASTTNSVRGNVDPAVMYATRSQSPSTVAYFASGSTTALNQPRPHRHHKRGSSASAGFSMPVSVRHFDGLADDDEDEKEEERESASGSKFHLGPGASLLSTRTSRQSLRSRISNSSLARTGTTSLPAVTANVAVTGQQQQLQAKQQSSATLAPRRTDIPPPPIVLLQNRMQLRAHHLPEAAQQLQHFEAPREPVSVSAHRPASRFDPGRHLLMSPGKGHSAGSTNSPGPMAAPESNVESSESSGSSSSSHVSSFLEGVAYPVFDENSDGISYVRRKPGR